MEKARAARTLGAALEALGGAGEPAPGALALRSEELIRAFSGRRRRRSTAKSYRADLRAYERFAGAGSLALLADMSPEEQTRHMDDFCRREAARGLAPPSVGRRATALRTFLRMRRAECAASALLALLQVPPRPEERREWLLAWLVGVAGLSRRQIVALSLGDLDSGRRALLIRDKTGETRTVALPLSILLAVHAMRADPDYARRYSTEHPAGPDAPLLRSRSGKRLSQSGVTLLLRGFLARHGMDATVALFRS